MPKRANPGGTATRVVSVQAMLGTGEVVVGQKSSNKIGEVLEDHPDTNREDK
jgi:hypothetical protein